MQAEVIVIVFYLWWHLSHPWDCVNHLHLSAAQYNYLNLGKGFLGSLKILVFCGLPWTPLPNFNSYGLLMFSVKFTQKAFINNIWKNLRKKYFSSKEKNCFTEERIYFVLSWRLIAGFHWRGNFPLVVTTWHSRELVF